MSNGKIVVLGGSGFVGRHIVARLAAAGERVVVPARSRESAKHLIMLPTVRVVEADVYDESALAKLLVDASAVVNLVGIIAESRPGGFRRVHTELPRKIIGACRRTGVQRLVHMSALHADADGPSEYQRSKGEAEILVTESGLAWTMFQPSVIFGPEDSFLNLFARLQRLVPVLALACPDAHFQPVYVGDVAAAFVGALRDPATVHRSFPLCGPKVYTLRELVAYVGELTGHRRPIIGLGPRLSWLQARLLELVPGKPMTRDNLASMQVDSVCDGPFPAELGFEPTPLEMVAPSYLSPAAVRDRFFDVRTHSGR